MQEFDNQLHLEQEAQPQGHEPAPIVQHFTPQEDHEQQHKDLAQLGLPQTHQDLPPGHQEAAPVQHNQP